MIFHFRQAVVGLSFFLALSPLKSFASRAPQEGAIWANREFALLGSNGNFEGKPYSPAIRYGFSSTIMFPMNSSIEIGFLQNDRQKYTRLNLAAIGKNPQVTRGEPIPLWTPDWFLRLEFLSAIWNEGGHVAYSPAIEGGFSIRMTDAWAIALAARGVADTIRPDASMSSVVLSLVWLEPFRAHPRENP